MVEVSPSNWIAYEHELTDTFKKKSFSSLVPSRLQEIDERKQVILMRETITS